MSNKSPRRLTRMSRTLRGSVILLVSAAGLAVASPAEAANVSYYVDCRSAPGGSGTAQNPWNSLSSVNTHSPFGAGDKILLARGSTCNGQLRPLGSGTSSAPITIDAYGTGNRPVVAAGGVNGGAVQLVNQEYWTIQNIEVTNAVPNRDTTMRYGILVQSDGGGLLRSIRILNNFVHHVSGTFGIANSGFNSGTDPATQGGISVYARQAADGFDDVLIDGNVVENVGRVGIVPWDSTWTDSGGATRASTHVIVRNNTVRSPDADAILVYGTKGALIENNVASGFNAYGAQATYGFGCAAGIWATRGYDTLLQYNEAYDAVAGCDSTGFDIDLSSVRTTMQYNYSHDNAGGGYFVCAGDDGSGVQSQDNIIRYNISQNDGNHGALSFGCERVPAGLEVYNNVFYQGAGRSNAVIDEYCYGPCSSSTTPYSIRNNIFYNLGSGGYRLPGSGGNFSHNTFYGNHPASEPADPNKLTSDPLFVSAGTGGVGRTTTDGYKLQIGSPALSSGALIAANGAKDFFGNAVSSSSSPNRGAYEGPGVPASDPTSPPGSVTVTASSSLEAWGWGKSFVVDGNTETSANAAGYSSSNSTTVDHPETLQVDLGSSRTANRIILFPRNDAGRVGEGFPVDFTVQVTNDSGCSANWSIVATRSGYTKPGNAGQAFSFPAQSIRCVKVAATKLRPNTQEGNAYYLQFAEVEARQAGSNAGASVAAGSSLDAWGWSKPHLVNGDTNSPNGAYGYSSAGDTGVDHTESLTIDLGSARSATRVVLYPRNDAGKVGEGYPLDVTVQVSADSSCASANYTTVGSRSAYPKPDNAGQSFSFSSRSVRCVKVSATKLRPNAAEGNAYYLQLAEVETQ